MDSWTAATAQVRGATLQHIAVALDAGGAHEAGAAAALLHLLHDDAAEDSQHALPLALLEPLARALRSGLPTWRAAEGADAGQRSCAACVWSISRRNSSHAALGRAALVEALLFGSADARPLMLRLLGTLGRAAWSDGALRAALSRGSGAAGAARASKRARRGALPSATPTAERRDAGPADAALLGCSAARDWVRSRSAAAPPRAAPGGDAPQWLHCGALMDSLADGDARVRAAAAEAISRAVRGTSSRTLVAAAVDALGSSLIDYDVEVQLAAARGLATLLRRHGAVASTPSALRALDGALRRESGSGGGDGAERARRAALRAAAHCMPGGPMELVRLAAAAAAVATACPALTRDARMCLHALGRRNVGAVWLASASVRGAPEEGAAARPLVGASYAALYGEFM